VHRLENMLSQIVPVGSSRADEAQAHLDSLTKPPGSLGVLEDLARRVVMITDVVEPTVENKVIFTLAADHGVAKSGVSAFPPEVTPQMVMNFLQGGAAINVLAKEAGARVVVADMGVAADLDGRAGLIDKKVAYGTQNMTDGAAMTEDEAVRSLLAGVELFEAELERGVDLVGVGEMGIGNTTAAAAITAVMTGRPPAEVTGRGTGVDAAGLARKIDAIETALSVNAPHSDDAMGVLAKVGGFEVGGMAGVMLAAAVHRVPVILDGFIATAAALIAQGLAPAVVDYLIAGHRSVEVGHMAALEKLGLSPLLELSLRLGEGTGAALAMPMVAAAVAIYNEMATFGEAGVSGEGIS